MDYILVWNGVNGRVLAMGEIIFDTDQKPILGFEYDTITLDTNLNQASYTFALPEVSTVMISELDENQLNLCHQYCDTFLDMQDYEVHPYNSDKIYMGSMLKSKAIKLEFDYVVEQHPDIFTSKWDELDNKWYPIYAAFKEDGFPIMSPQVLSDEYVLFMTKKEWDNIPVRPGAVYSLDFVTLTWRDKRTLEKTKFDAIMDTRVYYEHSSIRTEGYRRSNEMSDWVTQHQEATLYLKDNKAVTPFLDGFLSVNSDLNKQELCNRIMEDYQNDATFAKGAKHGEMYSYIYRIKKATSNKEVDLIMKELYEKIGKYRVINAGQLVETVNMSKNLEEGIREDEILVFNNGKLLHARSKKRS